MADARLSQRRQQILGPDHARLGSTRDDRLDLDREQRDQLYSEEVKVGPCSFVVNSRSHCLHAALPSRARAGRREYCTATDAGCLYESLSELRTASEYKQRQRSARFARDKVPMMENELHTALRFYINSFKNSIDSLVSAPYSVHKVALIKKSQQDHRKCNQVFTNLVPAVAVNVSSAIAHTDDLVVDQYRARISIKRHRQHWSVAMN